MRLNGLTNQIHILNTGLPVCGVILMTGCRLSYISVPRIRWSYSTASAPRPTAGSLLEDESLGVPPETMRPTTEQDGTQPARGAEREQGQVESIDDEWPDATPVPAPINLELTLADARGSALNAHLDVAVQLIIPAIARTVISQETGRFAATYNGSFTTDAPPGLAPEETRIPQLIDFSTESDERTPRLSPFEDCGT
jgi:hypothetical protein